ncbi:TPA: hypothetical protein ACW7U9_004653, partial [Citrobacter freundii]
MAHKTKATMPGRQCSTENKKQNQHTRPVAGGQRLSAPEITGTAPLARFTPVLAFTPKRGNTQYFPQWGECEPVAHTLLLRTSLGCVQILPLCSSVLANSNIECRGQRNFAPAVFTHDFVDLTYTKNVGQTPDLAFAQPFGSIPRLRNSALPNSFSQLLVLVFSACASSSNCLRNSAGMRIGSIGDLPPPLGCLSRDIDMYMPIGLWLTQIGIYTNMCESTKTTPRSAGTLPRRLTKPLIG